MSRPILLKYFIFIINVIFIQDSRGKIQKGVLKKNRYILQKILYERGMSERAQRLEIKVPLIVDLEHTKR